MRRADQRPLAVQLADLDLANKADVRRLMKANDLLQRKYAKRDYEEARANPEAVKQVRLGKEMRAIQFKTNKIREVTRLVIANKFGLEPPSTEGSVAKSSRKYKNNAKTLKTSIAQEWNYANLPEDKLQRGSHKGLSVPSNLGSSLASPVRRALDSPQRVMSLASRHSARKARDDSRRPSMASSAIRLHRGRIQNYSLQHQLDSKIAYVRDHLRRNLLKAMDMSLKRDLQNAVDVESFKNYSLLEERLNKLAHTRVSESSDVQRLHHEAELIQRESDEMRHGRDKHSLNQAHRLVENKQLYDKYSRIPIFDEEMIANLRKSEVKHGMANAKKRRKQYAKLKLSSLEIEVLPDMDNLVKEINTSAALLSSSKLPSVLSVAASKRNVDSPTSQALPVASKNTFGRQSAKPSMPPSPGHNRSTTSSKYLQPFYRKMKRRQSKGKVLALNSTNPSTNNSTILPKALAEATKQAISSITGAKNYPEVAFDCLSNMNQKYAYLQERLASKPEASTVPGNQRRAFLASLYQDKMRACASLLTDLNANQQPEAQLDQYNLDPSLDAAPASGVLQKKKKPRLKARSNNRVSSLSGSLVPDARFIINEGDPSSLLHFKRSFNKNCSGIRRINRQVRALLRDSKSMHSVHTGQTVS